MGFFSEVLNEQEKSIGKKLKALSEVIRQQNQEDNSIIQLKNRVSYLLRNKKFWSSLRTLEIEQAPNTTSFASLICLLDVNHPTICNLFRETQTEDNKNLENVKDTSREVASCLLSLASLLVLLILLGYVVFSIAVSAAGDVPLLMYTAELFYKITGYGALVSGFSAALLFAIVNPLLLVATKSINKHREGEFNSMFTETITLRDDTMDSIVSLYDELLAEPQGHRKFSAI